MLNIPLTLNLSPRPKGGATSETAPLHEFLNEYLKNNHNITSTTTNSEHSNYLIAVAEDVHDKYKIGK